MHFAAYAYVGESVQKPLLYYQNNIAGSAALLRAIVEWRPIPAVFASTCAIYGTPEQIPIDEDHLQRPINPYRYSKLVVEKMLTDVDQAHQVRSISLRYFNSAGADPGGEIGEAHNPEPHLIPRILAAARDDAVVVVYGNSYDTPDGTCIRDYIHVSDLANAHVLALKYLLSDGASCSLSLANARGYSVFEVVQSARRICGKRIRTKIAQPRPGDPRFWSALPIGPGLFSAGSHNAPLWICKFKMRGTGCRPTRRSLVSFPRQAERTDHLQYAG